MKATPKPVRPLHPALQQHGQRVKAAHAHLSQTVPGFRAQPFAQQATQVQAHIRRTR